MADPPVESATTQLSEAGFIGTPTDSTPAGATTFGVIGVAADSRVQWYGRGNMLGCIDSSSGSCSRRQSQRLDSGSDMFI